MVSVHPSVQENERPGAPRYNRRCASTGDVLTKLHAPSIILEDSAFDETLQTIVVVFDAALALCQSNEDDTKGDEQEHDQSPQEARLFLRYRALMGKATVSYIARRSSTFGCDVPRRAQAYSHFRDDERSAEFTKQAIALKTKHSAEITKGEKLLTNKAMGRTASLNMSPYDTVRSFSSAI